MNGPTTGISAPLPSTTTQVLTSKSLLSSAPVAVRSGHTSSLLLSADIKLEQTQSVDESNKEVNQLNTADPDSFTGLTSAFTYAPGAFFHRQLSTQPFSTSASNGSTGHLSEGLVSRPCIYDPIVKPTATNPVVNGYNTIGGKSLSRYEFRDSVLVLFLSFSLKNLPLVVELLHNI